MAFPRGPAPSGPAPSAPLPPPREPGTPYRVCLVCLGNICRSPMAETVLRASLAEGGLDGAVTLDSAGTGDWHIGEPMYQQARVALASRGYDGSGHRARQFRPSWLAERDLVLAMDAGNLATLRRLAGAADRDRIRLFGEVGGLSQAEGGEIPDPYGGDDADFGHVLDLLGSAAPVIAARLARLLEPGPGGPGRGGPGPGGPDRGGPGPGGPDRGGPGPGGPDRGGPGPGGPGPDGPDRGRRPGAPP